MSIRLWSDGHSFPREQVEACKDNAECLVELLTPRSTLVPLSYFTPEAAEELLLLAGLPCRESECAVWSEASDGVVAVMAIDRSTRDLLPVKTSFTSPLLAANPGGEYHALISRYEKLLYIKIWEKKLRLAETLTVANDEEVIYYLSRLEEVFPLRQYTLQTAGEKPRELRKLLKNYFK